MSKLVRLVELEIEAEGRRHNNSWERGFKWVKGKEQKKVAEKGVSAETKHGILGTGPRTTKKLKKAKALGGYWSNYFEVLCPCDIMSNMQIRETHIILFIKR